MSRRREAQSSVPDVLWERPSKEECWEDSETIGLEPPYFIVTRRLTYKGQLVEYAILLFRTESDGTKRELVSIDSQHGMIHRHDGGDHDPRNRIVIRYVESQSDVQNSIDESTEYIFDVYEASIEGPNT